MTALRKGPSGQLIISCGALLFTFTFLLKTRILLAKSSRASSIAQQFNSSLRAAHPHGVFLYHRKAVSYDIKKAEYH